MPPKQHGGNMAATRQRHGNKEATKRHWQGIAMSTPWQQHGNDMEGMATRWTGQRHGNDIGSNMETPRQ